MCTPGFDAGLGKRNDIQDNIGTPDEIWMYTVN